MAFWAFEKIKAEQKELDKINVCAGLIKLSTHAERKKKRN
jgi:hypothetical protein